MRGVANMEKVKVEEHVTNMTYRVLVKKQAKEDQVFDLSSCPVLQRSEETSERNVEIAERRKKKIFKGITRRKARKEHVDSSYSI